MSKNDKNSFDACVIGGAGYVGLITGLGLAEIGHKVINVDVDTKKNELLNKGQSPIYEEDIENFLDRNLKKERIIFTDDFKKGVQNSEIIFIAVGTPEGKDGRADLSQVFKVTEDLLKYMNDYKIIVLKSTVPVGTSRAVKNILEEKFEYHKDFDIISNPEFLREGKGLEDFLHPQRIIIGGDSEDTIKIIKKLYKPLLDKNIPLVETNIVSAQIIKYASNTFLATRVSFINEIANLCENIGANVNDVIQGMGYDRRIGHSYLKPGSGFGGPCLSKDLKALIKISEDSNYEPAFLKAILDKNEHQSQQIVKKIKESLDFPFYKKLITIYGLAFKEGTNDVRDSVSLRVIKQLLQEGIQIKAYDPKAITEAKRILPKIDYCYNPYEAVDCSELLVILTAWSEFRKLEYREIKNKMVSPKIFDVENILNSNELKSLGFIYKGIGNQ